MHVVAEKERPGAATFGQSPFALAQGVTFERSLFANDAERLLAGLAREGVLPSPSAKFVDFRLRTNGGPMQELDEAATRTKELLRQVSTADGRNHLPIVAAGPALELPGQPVLLPEAMLVIDALVIRPSGNGAELVVGEVKTYPDRAGFTSRAELATARAQAGVYVHALTITIRTLALDRALNVAKRGFLVLARPGSGYPRIRANEELFYQAHRAERGFQLLRDVAKDLEATFAEPPTEAEVDAVLAAKTCYRTACLSFCERAQACHGAAFLNGDPIVLGDDVKRFLGDVRLDRAAALLRGSKPNTVAERSFVERALPLLEMTS
jgi:hypothetical protein